MIKKGELEGHKITFQFVLVYFCYFSLCQLRLVSSSWELAQVLQDSQTRKDTWVGWCRAHLTTTLRSRNLFVWQPFANCHLILHFLFLPLFLLFLFLEVWVHFYFFLFGFGQLRWHLTTLRSQHTNYNPQSPFVSTKEVKQPTYS